MQTMEFQRARRLGKSILANSLVAVVAVLNEGLGAVDPLFRIDTYWSPDKDIDSSALLGRFSENVPIFCTHLHVAIFNAMKSKSSSEAIDILQALLKAIESLSYQTNIKWQNSSSTKSEFCVHHVAGFEMIPSTLATPIEMALQFKGLPDLFCRENSQLSECISLLVKHDEIMKAKKQAAADPFPVKKVETVPVPASLLKTFSALLFNEEHADVVFTFASSGSATRLFAHKSILSCSSEFMKVLLAGSWLENSAGAMSVVQSLQSEETIRALLTFIYTGRADEAAIKANTLEMLDVAAQHGSEDLTAVCEQQACLGLTKATVLSTIAIAYLHDLAKLKAACINFVKENASAIMFTAAFARLKKSSPAIWADLRLALGAPEDDEEEDDEEEEEEEENGEGKAKKDEAAGSEADAQGAAGTGQKRNLRASGGGGGGGGGKVTPAAKKKR